MKLPFQLEAYLETLKQQSLYRSPEEVSVQQNPAIEILGSRYLNFSSNNYLSLSNHPKVVAAAIGAAREWGVGSGASRLLSGNLTIHADLEKKLAVFKNEEAAAVFSSGYLANLAAVTSLLDERDLVVVDRLSHASLVDAARLSMAKLWVYPHRDVGALADILKRGKHFRRKMVLTDSYFSMDGDVAPLDGLLEVCEKNNAMLLVDEAHATGVFGEKGRGLTERFGLQGRIDIVMGTLSKALGSVGGFVAGRMVLKKYLVNRGREFIYTTAPSPCASAAALAALGVIEAQPQIRRKLWDNVCFVRERLLSFGFDLMDSEGPIIPILIGDTATAVFFYEELKIQGIFAPVIRPPTVAKNTDRIRLSIQASHDQDDLEKLVAALKKLRVKLK